MFSSATSESTRRLRGRGSGTPHQTMTCERPTVGRERAPVDRDQEREAADTGGQTGGAVEELLKNYQWSCIGNRETDLSPTFIRLGSSLNHRLQERLTFLRRFKCW